MLPFSISMTTRCFVKKKYSAGLNCYIYWYENILNDVVTILMILASKNFSLHELTTLNI